ncbi:MAG: molybdenum cofactor synthesis domain-containing protein [Spirochaetaceae bacterium]
MSITVGSINISERKGTVKKPIPRAEIDEYGVKEDAHAGDWHRQISLLGRPSISRFEERMSRSIGPGEFGENLTIEGLDLNDVAVLDRFTIGEAELEITQIGKTCHGDDCAIFREVGKCVMPQEGLFARVLKGGPIHEGQEIHYRPRDFTVRVITVSDRVSAGVYRDLSGPRALELIKAAFSTRRFHLKTEYEVVPDDQKTIEKALSAAKEAGEDVVVCTGGTGIGPRDVTPEAVSAVAEKSVPGVMDHIRLGAGAQKPNALLSRSICAVGGQTIFYALPGSVKAVEEYLRELLKTLDHMVTMLHGIGH